MLNVLLADDETRTLHHLMTGVPGFNWGWKSAALPPTAAKLLPLLNHIP